ncbi:MAG: sulfurtransferase complex subunit TusB [Methylococcaceae bacterium]|jgi:tRNA 2-thiouridine synthesizing protein B|nr:sulfurtransferase complex subunit TusB [Methylococcaceae bacterium]MDZ4157994.1 sulfurtransferase complex subunit TusB [Methylococcales bacterium]MDP2392785.1 sulfurtransferase complex subunit TusB [Methylococcaceae bacterium]MDP3020313.1 sulfurtransferase complex subunit TusB [Methylococcaceae bacterium]MDP3391920.1 sulfurtransferase complex subunit TusB [Methylococcaceae bacterium]
MLHLIFQSPIEQAVLQRIDPGDVVVFMENALLRILQNGVMASALATLLKTNRLCVMSEDIIVRGIAVDALITGIDVIDYAELVELTVHNSAIQSWT